MNAPLNLFTLFLLILGFAGLAVLLWRTRSQESAETLAPKLSELLGKSQLDVLERFTRANADLREGLQEKLFQGFLATQERIDKALTQNRTELQGGLTLTTQALETKFRALQGEVGVRLETIGKKVEDKLEQNLKEGFAHFTKVTEHLQAAELKLASLGVVGQSINELNQLLKLPHLRGGFGEATLERLLADCMPTGSFELQFAIDTDRVDAAVRLVNLWLPIDSKFPREQVLPLFESHEPAALELARAKLREAIQVQAKSIAKKYIRPDLATTEMALLFLPSETLYFEVVRDGALYEMLNKLKVYPVSPNTLAISLNSIALAQEYYTMAKGVEKTLEEVSKARKHFGHFETKFDDIGRGLKKAQESFETAQTHLGRYGNAVTRLIGGEAMADNSPTPPVNEPTLPS